MTDGKKTENAASEIIELVAVIDWRYVVLGVLAGAAVVFVVLAMIEHSDVPAPEPPEVD